MVTNKLMTDKPKLAVLISGRGSNMMAIYQAVTEGLIDAELALVVSNRSKAAGLIYADDNKLNPTTLIKKKDESREAYDARLISLLKENDIDAVVLAGYNRIISDGLIEAFQNRIINIHPSLLPKYGGYKMVGDAVHQAVIENQETVSGCTVHLVTKEVDAGQVLGQAKVPVKQGDTVETLSERVLEQEHILYSRVLAEWISSGFDPVGFHPLMIDSTIEAHLSKI